MNSYRVTIELSVEISAKSEGHAVGRVSASRERLHDYIRIALENTRIELMVVRAGGYKADEVKDRHAEGQVFRVPTYVELRTDAPSRERVLQRIEGCRQLLEMNVAAGLEDLGGKLRGLKVQNLFKTP